MNRDAQIKAISACMADWMAGLGNYFVAKVMRTIPTTPNIAANLLAILDAGDVTVRQVCERLAVLDSECDWVEIRFYSNGCGQLTRLAGPTTNFDAVDPSGRAMLTALDQLIAERCRKAEQQTDEDDPVITPPPRPQKEVTMTFTPGEYRPPRIDVEDEVDEPEPTNNATLRPSETRKECANRWAAEWMHDPIKASEMPQWFLKRLEERERAKIEPEPANDPRLSEIGKIITDCLDWQVCIWNPGCWSIQNIGTEKEIASFKTDPDPVTAIRRLTAKTVDPMRELIDEVLRVHKFGVLYTAALAARKAMEARP